MLTVASFQFFAAGSAAQPVVIGYDHFTSRFAPHSIPGGLPVGDKVQIAAVIDSSDPVGSPTISVEAIQGDTTLSLDPVPPSPLFEGFHLYYKFIDFDSRLLGSWEIIPRDSTGTGPSTITNAIADPEFLPFVNNITVQSAPLGARVAWTLPNLNGFDVDAVGVRIIEAISGSHVWQDVLPIQTTVYEPPAGPLQVGVDYVYNIILSDDESFGHENASWSFSEPFRFTVAGDFNTDGTVDAADYVVWRKGLGTIYDDDDFGVWRANFGRTLLTSTNAALPYVQPLPTALPEPAALCLVTIGLVIVARCRSVRRRPSPKLQVIAAAILPLVGLAASAQADIFQWEYINPADPSQGKQQSTTLTPDGAGVDAVPGANLTNRDLTMAYLNGARLSESVTYCYFACHTYTTTATITGAILTDADLTNANLSQVSLWGADLTGADFTNAVVSRVRFDAAVSRGFTAAQLYSTANYLAHNLAGIGLGGNDLSGWDFNGQDLSDAYFGSATLTATKFNHSKLTNARFGESTLTAADFTGAEVRGASFSIYNGVGSGITLLQLYSTASYKDHDLSRIGLSGNVLSGGNFVDQDLAHADLTVADLERADLTNSNLFGAYLTDTDITDAQVRGANFARYWNPTFRILAGSGITLAQLYSTASYQVHELSGINVQGNDLAGANFARQNLINSDFSGAVLTGADFTGAEIRGANFSTRFFSNGGAYAEGTGITLSQLYSTASYQARELSGIQLYQSNLAGGNFADQNLSNAQLGNNLAGASFRGANLTKAIVIGTLIDADFTGADVRGAQLFSVVTLSQLYSTASYQGRDLNGISLRGNLSGGNFVGQNLTNARLDQATLTDADLTGAEVRGASFGYPGITLAQLYSTASYQARDLTGISLCCDLSGANFAGQNLSNAKLPGTLIGADFTDAEVRGASIFQISLAQLYSTASYGNRDLSGVHLTDSDLAGADFGQQNLNNANLGGATLSGVNFRAANLANVEFTAFSGGCPNSLNSSCGYATALTGADLTAADARGAVGLSAAEAITANLIWPDGHIRSLELGFGSLLIVRDDDVGSLYFPDAPPIPITVDEHMTMGPGTLRVVFEADKWDSTISFAPGILVTLGGTLELTFADNVNLASQIGRTFDLFDWTGVAPTGAFAVSSSYRWNLTNLYTTGEVTLIAVPEPTFAALLPLAVVLILIPRRLRPAKNSC